MEKIAILELNPNYIKMQEVEVEINKSYIVYNEVSTPINMMKNFRPDCFIKAPAVNDILEILSVYKAMLDKEEITQVTCFASNVLNEAKNREGIINEILNSTTFKFEILEPQKEIEYIYTAIINSFNKPKGLIINIDDHSTQLLLYNRRNILMTFNIPFGRINLLDKFFDLPVDERLIKMQEFFANQITEEPWNFPEFETDWEIIGTGNLFRALGVLNRRAKKYPLEIEHNYNMDLDDTNKILEVIKSIEPARSNKIKGINNVDSMYLASGICIIKALLEKCHKQKFAISRTDKEDGILFNYALPLTLEKPISDTLGYSLQASYDYYDKPSNAQHIYDLSITLFKLFKVIHKLNRSYVRILRIASYLVNSGNRTSFKDRIKSSFNIIENTTLYGVSHAEIILACFVSKLRDGDNFNLAEWVKYKDIIGDVDINAIKRLAVIIRIAESLDITKFNIVKDIDCDILGDSFILKLVTEGNPCLEIRHALLAVPEFKKAYGKGLEFM